MAICQWHHVLHLPQILHPLSAIGLADQPWKHQETRKNPLLVGRRWNKTWHLQLFGNLKILIRSEEEGRNLNNIGNPSSTKLNTVIYL